MHFVRDSAFLKGRRSQKNFTKLQNIFASLTMSHIKAESLILKWTFLQVLNKAGETLVQRRITDVEKIL